MLAPSRHSSLVVRTTLMHLGKSSYRRDSNSELPFEWKIGARTRERIPGWRCSRPQRSRLSPRTAGRSRVSLRKTRALARPLSSLARTLHLRNDEVALTKRELELAASSDSARLQRYALRGVGCST